MSKRKKKKIDEYVYLDPIDEARRARDFARRQRRADSLMSYLTDKTDEERIRDAQLAQQAVLAKGRHKAQNDETDAASVGSDPAFGDGLSADGGTGDNAADDAAGSDASKDVSAEDTAAGDASAGDASGEPAADFNESDIEDPFERILRSADLASIPEEEWNDEDFWNHAEILKPQEEEYKIWKPWILFLASIVCTALFCLIIYTSWQAAGDLRWYWGIAGMAMTLASFAGTVFGIFDLRKMARHKQAQGILGFILFLIVFLLMAGLYVLGLGML